MCPIPMYCSAPTSSFPTPSRAALRRLELPRRRVVSAYLSYTNSRVIQYGPFTGGSFLEDELIDIEDGTASHPITISETSARPTARRALDSGCRMRVARLSKSRNTSSMNWPRSQEESGSIERGPHETAAGGRRTRRIRLLVVAAANFTFARRCSTSPASALPTTSEFVQRNAFPAGARFRSDCRCVWGPRSHKHKTEESRQGAAPVIVVLYTPKVLILTRARQAA